MKIFLTEICLMKRWISLMRVVLIAAFLSSCATTTKNSVLIENASRESVSRISIRIGKARLVATELSAGASVERKYRFDGEGDFEVTVEFSSGKKLNSTSGYVTHGMTFRHKIVIEDDDVSIELVSAS